MLLYAMFRLKGNTFCLDDGNSRLVMDALREADEQGVKVLIKAHYPELPPPVEVSLTVIAPDWPGLVEAISWNIHSLGFNISEIHAFVAENHRGVVHLSIKTKDESEIEKLKNGISKVKRTLELSALGDPSIRRLVEYSISKIKRLNELFDALNKVVQNQDEYKEIVAPEGELEKFLVSRTDAYLNDKTPIDLARQIYTNYKFIKELRKTGKRVLVSVTNEKTGDHEQTCITVAGFEEDITLDKVLNELRQYTLNYKVKYSKQFVTEDGITVVRVEVTMADGRTPFPKDELALLQVRLKNRLSKRPPFVTPVTPNYVELIMRLVMPRLQEEARKSKMPQFYLIPENISPDFIDFVMVLAIPKKGEKLLSDKLQNAIGNIKGITITSFRPYILKDIECYVFWLRATPGQFKEDEEIYRSVRNAVEQLVGPVRDFDEGMRTRARRNLKQVIDILKESNIDESFVRQYFYNMSDFARVAYSPEEIAQEILLAYKLLSQFPHKQKAIEKIENKNWIKIGFVLPEGSPKVEKFIGYLSQQSALNPTWTHFEDYGAALVVIHITLQGKAREEKLKIANELFEKIKQEIENPDDPPENS